MIHNRNVNVIFLRGMVAYICTVYVTNFTVEVISAKIVKRQPHDRNEQFVPATSSPYAMIVNEGAALIQYHDAPTREQYMNLLTRPVKSVISVKSLKVILDNIEALYDRFVDLLVVVTFVSHDIYKLIPG